MRLFVAVDLPDAVKNQLERLRADIPGAVWVKRQALHLTLQFLGDGIPEERLPEIIGALQAVDTAPFDLTLKGVGRFPPGDRKPPRVLWVGVTGAPPLNDLYRQVTGSLTRLGFAPDERGFSPHITLARLKQDDAGPRVAHFIERFGGYTSDPIPVREFILFSSQLTAQGSNYTREGVFTL
jgi:2'-5' RNA ligase